MNIKINYSKLDFTKIDFYFLSIFLSHFCGGISLIVYKKEKLGVLVLIAPVIFYTIPRLKSENYIKILGFYPLLKKFIISSLFKWGLVLYINFD